MASSSSSQSSDDSSHYCEPCNRSFSSSLALSAHLNQSSRHNYCASCSRDFRDANALRYHLASNLHQRRDLKCLRCTSRFGSASALAKHIEAGKCIGITNKQIVQCVRRWEEASGNANLLTIPRIGWRDSIPERETTTRTRIRVTKASFDGEMYVCPLCPKEFHSLRSLEQHVNSSVHESDEFRCKKCRRKFREFSALIAHGESEACGAMSAKSIKSLAVLAQELGTLAIRY